MLMKLEFSLRIVEKYTNIIFRGILSSRSRIAPYESTDGRTDMTNLLVAFHNFSNEP